MAELRKTKEMMLITLSIFHFFFFCRGATHSKAVICDKDGSIVSKVVGPGTNHWVCGIPEVARRIAAMIKEAKTEANIDQSVKLQSLGLSLSGCEQVLNTPFLLETQDLFLKLHCEANFKSKYFRKQRINYWKQICYPIIQISPLHIGSAVTQWVAFSLHPPWVA